MEYVTCSKCGSDEFIKVIAIPIVKDSPKVILEERKIICNKCQDELTASEVNKALGMV